MSLHLPSHENRLAGPLPRVCMRPPTAVPRAAAGRATSMPNKGLTEVAGIRVGHHTLTERPTGCTVILVEATARRVVCRSAAARRGRARRICSTR